jgi:sugar-specific transcriptional regulator TrmB
MREPQKYLKNLGLSDSEVTVYLGMVSGIKTAHDLVKVTGLKRPTVYYALGSLEKRGLVSRPNTENDNGYVIASLSRLNILAEEKEREVKELRSAISELVPSLAMQFAPTDHKPTVAFFEGVSAVKNVIMEMVYCRNKKINSVVPKVNFFHQVGQDFVQLFVEERVRRNIRTKNLWEEPADKKLVKQYYENLSEIRILPAVMVGKFKTTIFLYDDKTLYISSLHNSYCVLITSQEHHDTMQAWFDGLWFSSQKI